MVETARSQPNTRTPKRKPIGVRGQRVESAPGRLSIVLQLNSLAFGVSHATPGFLRKFRQRLRERRFWIVQAMIGGVTASLTLGEAIGSASGHSLGAAYFIPASIYFFPVLYASLNFGKEGAIPTAILSALLSLPNMVAWHTGLERVGEAFQMAVILLMATVVAWKVDKETSARKEAEEFERARRISELKYRALFDAAGEACLVFDHQGIIREANAAAAELVGQPIPTLTGAAVASVLEGWGAELLRAARRGPGVTAEIGIRCADGSEAWIQPICTSVPTAEGALVQALLKDVTERHRLHQFAEAFVRAEEEERRRIAHELYDVSLQSLVVLWRRLAAVQEATAEEFPEAVTAVLAEARRSTNGLADDLRRYSKDLCPIALGDLGVERVTEGLVAELSKGERLHGRLTVAGSPRPLPPSIEIALFRIAQEALRNIECHAEASRFAVKLSYGRGVRLTVTDNGKGFEVPSYTSLASTRRFGLLSMRERARLTGGACRITSGPGKGTRVEVQMPTQAESFGSRQGLMRPVSDRRRQLVNSELSL
jgi:PAS domain S-box-containing protein